MAKEIAHTQLNQFERAFVRAMAQAGNPGKSVVLCGYVGKEPETYGYALLEHAHIAAALQLEIRRRLVMDAPASVKVLRELREHVADGCEHRQQRHRQRLQQRDE